MQTTDDRTAQVGWLRELAANLAAQIDTHDWPDGYTAAGIAQQIVDWYVAEGVTDEGDTMPEWFDDHDRSLLVGFVEEAL